MSSKLVRIHFEGLKKSRNKFDRGFIDILMESNESGEDGQTAAGKLLNLIKERYAKSKENKA